MVPKAQKPNLQQLADRVTRLERNFGQFVIDVIDDEKSTTSHGRTMWILGLATGYLIAVVLIRVDQKNRQGRKR